MFSTFTKPKFPKAALGLEWDRVALVSLDRTRRGEFSISRAAVAELPAGLVDPNFRERNIWDPRELSEVLHDAATRAGLLRQRRWSVALPSGTSRTAILTLDSEPASKNELNEILDWKAENSFGAPASSLRLSAEKISPDAQGKSRYFATAVVLDVLAEYEDLFRFLGWQAGMVLPRAVCEAEWLGSAFRDSDTLLISSTWDGFTALLLRGDEPLVVRSVTCTPSEMDDEVYRLLLFYNDKLRSGAAKVLDKILVTGRAFDPGRIRSVAVEALGRDLMVLNPDDVGLSMPGAGLKFDDLAAPAGVASLAFR